MTLSTNGSQNPASPRETNFMFLFDVIKRVGLMIFLKSEPNLIFTRVI